MVCRGHAGAYIRTMSDLGPIVCATDLGTTGARAVTLAGRIAAATGRPLRIVHVTGAAPAAHAEGSELSEAERVFRARLETRRNAADKALRTERERAEAMGPHAVAELLSGRPWEEVIRYAERHQASMLVIGPHADDATHTQRGSFSEWVLGSTADRVVRHAPCPVLVGPRGETEDHPLGRSKWLVAVDFSAPSKAAMTLAHELASKCDASPILLHVEPGLTEQNAGEPMRFATEANARKQELEALSEELLGQRHTVHLAFGEPADSVAVAADELGAHLIVMGTRGRTGLAHLLLGSTAERTLRRAHVPVLCVRG